MEADASFIWKLATVDKLTKPYEHHVLSIVSRELDSPKMVGFNPHTRNFAQAATQKPKLVREYFINKTCTREEFGRRLNYLVVKNIMAKIIR